MLLKAGAVRFRVRRGRVGRFAMASVAAWVVAGVLVSPALATTVTGDEDTNAPLVIDPSTDAQTAITESGTVLWVQRMPVSKTIDSVTLGDFGQPQDCSDETSAFLTIRHWPTMFSSDSTTIGDGAQPVTVPQTMGRLTWAIPPTTLLKGHTYSFAIGLSGCSHVRQTTWSHDGPVEGGNDQCAEPPELGQFHQAPYAAQRVWHVYGHDDGGACVPPDIEPVESDMPTGWLVSISPGNTRYLEENLDVSNASPPQTCNDSVFGPELGVTPVFWRPSESNPDSHGDWVCQWIWFLPKGFTNAGAWYYGYPWRLERDSQPSDVYARLGTIDYDALLQQYAPTLVYDSQEQYFAMHADSIATNVSATGCLDELGFELANILKRGSDDARLKWADPQCGSQLTLGSLVPEGDTYPGTATQASASDYINEVNDYAAASARAYLSGGYADHIYGRAYQDSAGRLWLEYWFFYYFNDGMAPLNGFDHEGDWERIIVKLDSSNTPVRLLYAQHDDPFEVCDWGRVGKQGLHPEVFPALGRHASYVAPGSYPRPPGAVNPFGPDTNDGAGPVIHPVVDVVTADVPWIRWPGRWGASDATPQGPGFHGDWNDPQGAQNDAQQRTCEGVLLPVGASAKQRRSARRTSRRSTQFKGAPGPTLAAQRSVDRRTILVRYNTRTRLRDRRVYLLVTAHTSAPGVVPTARWIRVRRASGTLRIQTPRGRGRLEVKASVMSQRSRSRVRTVKVA